MEPAAEPHLGRMEDQEAAKQAGKEPKEAMAHPLIPLKPQIKLGLEDQVDCLLPALRQAGIGRDCLKAVLTPHNRTWTAVKLYQELLREHQAMNGR